MEVIRRENAPAVLSVAMDTLAAAEGLDVNDTSADVVRGRALRHYAESLRQYFLIRVGELQAANSAMHELREIVLSWPALKMLEPPSPRAHMFRAAREIVRQHLGTRLGSAIKRRSRLPWRPVGPDAPKEYVAALEALRLTLHEDTAEVLELRYARELSPPELAYVLDLDIEDLERMIDAAEEEAREILGPSPASRVPGLAGALLEAFALQTDRSHVAAVEVADERPPLPEGLFLGGRFQIERRVGMGAFSDVYRAFDSEVPGHVVALKLLHQPSLSESSRQNALRELHLIASVFHPSVVNFKDYGWHENRLWFVMPWYEGETLETRINQHPLTRAEARRIFEPLARALATLHATGIRHQDIKPDNIFLARIQGFSVGDEAGDVWPVLLDLGVAAREAEVLVAGTPMYFAPEVAARFASIAVAHPITHKADVFALALSLRNALEPESQEDVPAGAVEAFIEHRATNLPSPPRDKELQYLHPYFERWMSLNPAERPTAEAFADELAVLTRPEEHRQRLVGIVKWLGPLVAALAVVFVAVVYVLWKQSKFQQLEAIRARLEAQEAREGLNMEHARATSLEKTKSELLHQYERSRLNRHQLAVQLASSEGRARLLDRELGNTDRKRRKLEKELEVANKRTADLEDELTKTRARVAAESANAADLANQLTQSRTHAGQVQEELNGAVAQARQLNTEVQSIRNALAAEQTRARELDRRILQAENTRLRVQSELTDARRRIAQLERDLETERQKRKPEPPPQEPEK
jgi:eukaryotic-like serine/threonine-protein kinase